MIIVRTPLRVSFFGGGTDHPGWFKHHGEGAVLSTTINKYVYITLRHTPPVFDFNYRVVWREIEQTRSVDEIVHPVVREVLRNYTSTDAPGYEIVYNADLPARSGLGSSSAFTVAALHALWHNSGEEVSKMRLAREAIRVEQDLLKEPVGSQDQTAVAFGGLNQIDFGKDGGLTVSPIQVSGDRMRHLEDHLMMFFTGFTRDAGSIEKNKVENFANKREQMEKVYSMVAEGRRVLEDDRVSLLEFGDLLDQGWRAKRSLATGVSNGPIDQAYELARQAGAIGGKLLGAGGGGFLLFFVPPDRRAAVAEAMSRFEFQPGRSTVEVPFRFEDLGSSVVLHRPELTSNYTGLRLPQLQLGAA
ncbi:kinase [Caulobacter flavus]|jgi:D-glycero-alpha-D-manno-heptose-7-phosphate kinase|uniref:Kinase n=1 Tax=Caulobacter flavus TaxID=1679497 RepID=A0A2N5D648_9CAUL|nr:kinase [Caulobacter flavus]AYV45935.1 kinase [Caulobacter flavus]PLR21522.1 kinase [Caulobacter flavus]